MSKSTLLTARLHKPEVPARYIPRPHLLERMQEGLNWKRKITLVSAPAGFGKTSCTSEWIQSLKNANTAWLSLDYSNNDPAGFFTYFLAALQQIYPDLNLDLAGILHAGHLPAAETISVSLLNDLQALSGRAILVLDDFHVIQDTFILQVMEKLIQDLPSSLHLVILSREDPPLPLARLRANNLLTEIRARDLRFSPSETEAFMKQAMNLTLSHTDLAELEERTEGWIAGLQLAGLLLRGQDNPSRSISSLHGSHRFILSYLTEQVLNQQSDEVRDFLLQTSILDTLNANLCNAVTGRTDGRKMLETLHTANLFLIPLDNEHQWYRYHNLFTDLLRDLQINAKDQDTNDLHRRACRWFLNKNMPGEAIKHALNAGEYSLVAELLEKHAMDMIMQGYAGTVYNWITSMPEHWKSSSISTNLALAWMHLLRGSFNEVIACSDLVKTALDKLPEPGRGKTSSQFSEWEVIQALIKMMQGKTSQAVKNIRRALELVPEENTRVRSLGYYTYASILQQQNETVSAFEMYQKAYELGKDSDSLVAELFSLAALAVLAFEQGKLTLALELTEPACAKMDQSHSLPPVSGVVFGVPGEIYVQRCSFPAARKYILRALRLSTLGDYRTGKILCRVLLSRLLLLEGDLANAAVEIRGAVDGLQSDTSTSTREETTAQQIQVYLAQGNLDTARMVLQKAGFFKEEQEQFLPLPLEINYSTGLLHSSALRFALKEALLHPGQTPKQSIRKHTDSLLKKAGKQNLALITIETLLLRSELSFIEKNRAAGVKDLTDALYLGMPESILAPFSTLPPSTKKVLTEIAEHKEIPGELEEYTSQILHAASLSSSSTISDKSAASSIPAAPNDLIEPLTERELAVLALMAEGLKYKEIAEKLYISLNTVRYHVKSAYGKLGVNNRTQAVDKVRSLSLI